MATNRAKPLHMAPAGFGNTTGVRVGKIIAIDEDGRTWVDYPGNPSKPLTARTIETIALKDIGCKVLLLFENNDPQLPIIAGCIKETATDRPVTRTVLDSETISEILVDGKTLLLEAEERVEIRCGKSSLILRHDGKVIIKGEQVLSRARRVNKIKGGSVQIN